MRMPKARGKPLDPRRFRSWLNRFRGYRIEVSQDRIEEWLRCFRKGDENDMDLGARVLDALFFLKPEDLENSLRNTVNRLPGWHKRKARRQGRWRFLAFSISAGESGDMMISKARTALGLTSSKHNELFIHKSELFKDNLTADDSVAFFDDFAGTGQQACNAWRETIAELLPGNPKTYLILVAAGRKAVSRIEQETSLRVRARHLLGPSDNIFSGECLHFTQPEKDTLLDYCKIAGPRWPRGYGDCGFVIVLTHRTPNNSIPVLYANHRRWKGLFPRQ